MEHKNDNKIIVAFHIGRGGRFHNPGHKKFIGEKDLQELIALNSNNLYEYDRDNHGRFCAPYLADCSGKVIVEPEDMHNVTGRLDFDGSYDTDLCCYIEDCSDEDLDIIFDSGEWVSWELRDYLKKHYNEIGDERRIEETSRRYGWN